MLTNYISHQEIASVYFLNILFSKQINKCFKRVMPMEKGPIDTAYMVSKLN